jgi:hypothetical protein
VERRRGGAGGGAARGGAGVARLGRGGAGTGISPSAGLAFLRLLASERVQMWVQPVWVGAEFVSRSRPVGGARMACSV